jgi:hypothetical protein
MFNINSHSRNATIALTITALLFAVNGVAAMTSSQISLLPYAYAQGSQQDESNVTAKATSMSAAVDGTLRYYAKAIGAQYRETDIRPIAGAENINALDDVTIPSVPIASERNTTGIVSMADYLIATGLLDKSYELFLETAREMRNVTAEDVTELQTSLLQLNSLIENRAPYNLAEDVVQNLQGHLQRTLASTEEFTSATTTTPGAATDGDGGGITNDNLGNTTTTTSSADSTSTTPSDATATTGTTSNTTTTTTAPNNADASGVTDSGPLFP